MERETNIERCKKYMKKQEMLGTKTFEFRMNDANDKVIITKYIPDESEYRVIEIPSFVTSIDVIEQVGITVRSVFSDVKQSLKIIHKNNQIQNMSGIFCEFKGKKLDLSEFDTTNVRTLKRMFLRNENLEELNLSGFDTSKVWNFTNMLGSCENLKEVDMSMFDTSNATLLNAMFARCHKLEKLDLRNFDTSNAITMENMFIDCAELREIDVSSFNTSEVENMQGMFCKCMSLKELNISNFDTSKVESMNRMFYNCLSLEGLNLSNFTADSLECMRDMFAECVSLTKLDLSNFHPKLEDDEQESIGMFRNCREIELKSGSDIVNKLYKERFTGYFE